MDDTIAVSLLARVQALESENAQLRAQIETLQYTARLLRSPCRCDPVGSGEEFCSQHCRVEESFRRHLDRDSITAAQYWHAMRAYDAAVEEVRDRQP
jgi:hypothetical protein